MQMLGVGVLVGIAIGVAVGAGVSDARRAWRRALHHVRYARSVSGGSAGVVLMGVIAVAAAVALLLS